MHDYANSYRVKYGVSPLGFFLVVSPNRSFKKERLIRMLDIHQMSAFLFRETFSC